MAAQGERTWTTAVGLCLAIVAALMVVGCGGDGAGGVPATWLFRVTDLGTLGGTTSAANAVNDSGQVVGRAWLPGDDHWHAFRWTGGSLIDLGTLGGEDSEARDINSQGRIVGTAQDALGTDRAFLYYNNQMHDIGVLPGEIGAEAEAINSAGQIVGMSGTPFLYDGTMHELPTPGGGGGAQAINSSGQVAGWFWLTAGSEAHAFRGTVAAATDLGANGGTGSNAMGINDDGDVVGYYIDGAHKRLFIYRNGAMTNIGTLGGASGQAHAINNAGVVVGIDSTGTNGSHAFLWDGTMHDLNDLLDAASQGWMLFRASDINNHHVIVGQGLNPQGEYHAFIARPI